MIVTMATEPYLKWLHHFLSSLADMPSNTQIPKTVVYLINVPIAKKKEMEDRFSWVTFREHTGNFKPKGSYDIEGNRLRVTYLKGQFLRAAIEEFGGPAIWIDATSVIRKPLEDIFDILRSHDFALVKRPETDPKKKYAAGFIGIGNLEAAREYELICNDSDEWYSDQLALSKLEGTKFFLDLETYCSFNYDPEAKIWADRGKNGLGMMTLEDVEYTEKKFIEDIYSRNKNYKDQYAKFIVKLVKPSILLFIDDHDWVYFTTAQEVVKQLKDDFEFTVILKASEQKEEIKKWNGDLVWARGRSRRAHELLKIRPDLGKKTISSITTGGELLPGRINEQLLANRPEAGVFVQNKEALTRLNYEFKVRERKQKAWILHNGVDIQTFKKWPGEKVNDFTAGFAARTIGGADWVKGFTEYVVKACEIAGVNLKICSNRVDEVIPHEQMPEFYNSIDVLLQPSMGEGCSNTIMEAMSCGVPCLISQTGWHGEQCIDMDEVIFVRRELNDIVEKIKLLKEDKALRNEIGKNARKFAEKYSWDKVAQHYKSVFMEAIRYVKQTEDEDRGIDKKDFVVIYKGKRRGISTKYGDFLRDAKTEVTADGRAYLKDNFPNEFEFL